MLEVEAKVAVENPAALRRQLEQAGARSAGITQQDDRFFQHPCRDLVAGDEALRVRRDGDHMDVTYKGPQRGGALKVRTEHAVPVLVDPTDMLEALGFKVAARLRKRRERFLLDDADGTLELSLDHLDGLGDFLEIECLDQDEGQARQRVHAALERLGLAHLPTINRAYLDLALDAGAAAADLEGDD